MELVLNKRGVPRQYSVPPMCWFYGFAAGQIKETAIRVPGPPARHSNLEACPGTYAGTMAN
jgi:hypothetical protein